MEVNYSQIDQQLQSMQQRLFQPQSQSQYVESKIPDSKENATKAVNYFMKEVTRLIKETKPPVDQVLHCFSEMMVLQGWLFSSALIGHDGFKSFFHYTSAAWPRITLKGLHYHECPTTKRIELFHELCAACKFIHMGLASRGGYKINMREYLGVRFKEFDAINAINKQARSLQNDERKLLGGSFEAMEKEVSGHDYDDSFPIRQMEIETHQETFTPQNMPKFLDLGTFGQSLEINNGQVFVK